MELKKISDCPNVDFPSGRRTHFMIGPNGQVKGDLFCQGFVDILPGGSIPEHEHETIESYTVISGQGEICVDGETNTIREGEYIVINPGQKHSLKNTSDASLHLIYVYAPQVIVDHWEQELRHEL